MATYKILGGTFSKSATLTNKTANAALQEDRIKTVHALKRTFSAFLFDLATTRKASVLTDTVPTFAANREAIKEITLQNSVEIAEDADWQTIRPALSGSAARKILNDKKKRLVLFAMRLKDGSQFLCASDADDYAKLLATPELTKEEQMAGMQKQTKQDWAEIKERAPLALVSLAVLIFLGFAIFRDSGDTTTNSEPEIDGRTPTEITRMLEVDAYTYCEERIKEGLKSPSTADFSMDFDIVELEPRDKADRSFLATGAVDAQNSFGAMLRNNFACVMSAKKSGDEWTWRYDEVSME